MTSVDELTDWLRTKARIHDKILGTGSKGSWTMSKTRAVRHPGSS